MWKLKWRSVRVGVGGVCGWWDSEERDGCRVKLMVGDRSTHAEVAEGHWHVRTSSWKGSGSDNASSCCSRSWMSSSCCFLSAICLRRKRTRAQAALVGDWGVRFRSMLRNLIWREVDLSLDLESGARGTKGGKSGIWVGRKLNGVFEQDLAGLSRAVLSL